jgi:hypothetical protein
MGRGDRPVRRWKNDRIRKAKARRVRQIEAARTVAAAAPDAQTQTTPPPAA